MSTINPGDTVRVKRGSTVYQHHPKYGLRAGRAGRNYNVRVKHTILDRQEDTLYVYWAGNGSYTKSTAIDSVELVKAAPSKPPSPAGELTLAAETDAAEALRLAELARTYADEAEGAAAAACLAAEQAEADAAVALQKAAEMKKRAGLKVIDGGSQSTLLETSKDEQRVMRAKPGTYYHFRARAEMLTEAALRGEQELLRVLQQLYVYDVQLARDSQVVGLESKPRTLTRDMDWIIVVERVEFALVSGDLKLIADVLNQHLQHTKHEDFFKVDDLIERVAANCDIDLRPRDHHNVWGWTETQLLVVDGNRYLVKPRSDRQQA